jgi:hypothetical protein
MTNDDDNLFRTDGFGKPQGIGKHRLAAQAVKDLGLVGLHARPFAGGKDNGAYMRWMLHDISRKWLYPIPLVAFGFPCVMSLYQIFS